MKITCPSCHTSYALNAEAIGEEGRDVRCARCKTQWHATPDAELADMVLRGAVAEEAEPADQFSNDIDNDDFDGGEVDGDDPMATVFDDIQQEIAEESAARQVINGDHGVPAAAAGGDVETAARKRSWKRPWKKRSGEKGERTPITLRGSAKIAVGIAATLLLLAVPMRESVVRWVPDLAGIYRMVGLEVNLRGLTFQNVHTSQGYENGVPYLLVEGEIENVAGKPLEVPAMRFSIRNRERREVYVWSLMPKKPIVAQGETLSFRTKVAAPPQGSAEVRVRFTDLDQRQASLIR